MNLQFVVATIRPCLPFIFFFNDTATTEIYTLSLHDALPICARTSASCRRTARRGARSRRAPFAMCPERDRKSTRLNSSHQIISYAVFCLKKKNNRVHKLSMQCSLTTKRQLSTLQITAEIKAH